jgi:hypothetical protein
MSKSKFASPSKHVQFAEIKGKKKCKKSKHSKKKKKKTMMHVHNEIISEIIYISDQ